MHRFYVPPGESQGPRFVLRGSEAHHALRVLRVRAGEQVTVLDGAGRRLLCEVESHSGDEVPLRLTSEEFVSRRAWDIVLFQAIPKAKLIEDIVEKSVELGVSRIVPVLSERVIVRLDANEGERKRQKWQTVAIEATKQCGLAWLPTIERPQTLEQILSRGERLGLQLIASLQPGAVHPSIPIRNAGNDPSSARRTAAVWIGPEGDFTPAEVQSVIESGATPVSLGPLVLRTETAAVFCLSVLNYELERSAVA